MLSENNATILNRMMQPDVYLSPYTFVMLAYDWGHGDLKEFDGPRQWQKDIMDDIEKYLRDAISLKQSLGILPDFYRHAVASGRGPGKSALVGMLTHWFQSTRIGGSAWVAANGETQLRTKTFPEIAKWFARGINSEFFEINATSIAPSKWYKEYIESPEGLAKNTRYYYTSGQLWSAENPDAFAGAHNFDGEFAIFDEASGIPAPIWTVQEGVFTENIVDRFWLAFSNPRQKDGAFFECFHKNRELWRTTKIDSRTVEGISLSTYDNIIKQFGADSDEARVEVYGEFPNTGTRQFIGDELIEAAMTREVYTDNGAPLLMGVDVARFGEDRTVIAFRQGRDARSIPWQTYRKIDLQVMAGIIVELVNKHRPDAVFIDGGGVGGGLVDQLKGLRCKVIEVQAGSSASDKNKYQNKRVEMWALMKEWMDTGCMPDDKDLRQDLHAPQYEWHPVTNQLKLESKVEMKKRGYASPDMAEALIQTFARPVARSDNRLSHANNSIRVRVARDVDYDILSTESTYN